MRLAAVSGVLALAIWWVSRRAWCRRMVPRMVPFYPLNSSALLSAMLNTRYGIFFPAPVSAKQGKYGPFYTIFDRKSPKNPSKQPKNAPNGALYDGVAKRFCAASAGESYGIGLPRGVNQFVSEAAEELQFLLPALANLIAAAMEFCRKPQNHVSRVNRWGKEICHSPFYGKTSSKVAMPR